MKLPFCDRLEKSRHRDGSYMPSNYGDPYGAFTIKGPEGEYLFIIANSGVEGQGPEAEWDHVSVSLPHRCPTWVEMCFVKDLFFSDDECVVQYHPAKSTYVNRHQYCLHLWRKPGINFPMPPRVCV